MPPWIQRHWNHHGLGFRRAGERRLAFDVPRAEEQGSGVRVCVRRSTFEWKLAFGVRRRSG
uniref:Uncharacterized protein n=1 Tax=Cucumis melo TaxID=3656 RepID=A0A9I9EFW5_CUCME